MKLLGLAIGGGAAAAVFLLSRTARGSNAIEAPSADPVVPPGFDPMRTYGETKRVALAVPPGWRRVTGAEVSAVPDLRAQANALRGSTGFTSLPYGTLSTFVASDGRTYATWVEQHFHEPGGPVKPWGLHHGVTLLAQI